MKRPAIGDVLKLAAALLAAGLCYFALARLGLMLALINPSATPIWPATGFAVAVVLLWGYRLLPAILAGAFAANVITAGSLLSSAVIALGNSLEAFIIVWMVNRWSDGRETFARPFAVAKFASIALTPGTMVSATIGVGVLVATGFASVSNYSAIWMTWWLGDVTGALLFTPFVVLWVNEGRRFLASGPLQSLAIYLAAAAVGIVAFSPLFEHLPYRGPLAFLALVPLVWAALRGLSARHRDREPDPRGVRRLGRALRHRSLRRAGSEFFLPDVLDVPDQRLGPEPRAVSRCRDPASDRGGIARSADGAQ